MKGATPLAFWSAVGFALLVSFIIDLANTDAGGEIVVSTLDPLYLAGVILPTEPAQATTPTAPAVIPLSAER